MERTRARRVSLTDQSSAHKVAKKPETPPIHATGITCTYRQSNRTSQTAEFFAKSYCPYCTGPLISSVIGILSRFRNVLSNDNHSIDGLSSKASVFQSFSAIQATILDKKHWASWWSPEGRTRWIGLLSPYMMVELSGALQLNLPRNTDSSKVFRIRGTRFFSCCIKPYCFLGICFSELLLFFWACTISQYQMHMLGIRFLLEANKSVLCCYVFVKGFIGIIPGKNGMGMIFKLRKRQYT